VAHDAHFAIIYFLSFERAPGDGRKH